VIGSCVEIEQKLVGGESKIINRRHDVTLTVWWVVHDRSTPHDISVTVRDILLRTVGQPVTGD
jgi:hypothetical protein